MKIVLGLYGVSDDYVGHFRTYLVDHLFCIFINVDNDMGRRHSHQST